MRKSNTKKFLLTLAVTTTMVALSLACAALLPQAESGNPGVDAPQVIQRVALEESKAAFDSGQATFVDVRSASSYEASHIPGALSIPLAELEGRLEELDPDQWIITYCT